MIRPIKLRRKRVLIDVDTQKDFMIASGSACIKNHRRVLMNIRRAYAWARTKHIRVVSTALCKERRNGDNLCIMGSDGQKKISYTLRNKRFVFEADNSTDLSRDLFVRFDQIILNKRCENPFDEPRAERLLTELRADEFVVIGAIAEGAVASTVLGLLQRGKRVVVLTDAIGVLDRNAADIAFRKMKAKGAILAETKNIAGATHLRTAGVCDCKLCKASEKEEKLQTQIA
ncbi:MAG: isochorismatase family protein [Phycisphaerae bacterium]|jgi:nicotinamidase-related amidase